MTNLSGGERRRVALCRVLLEQPDMLLLDEPTNHLDIESVVWLEDYLNTYPGAIILISHDRRLLDNLTNRTLAFEQGGVNLYSGNYSAFERARAEALALQQAMHVKQEREVAHLHAYIDRFRAKATHHPDPGGAGRGEHRHRGDGLRRLPCDEDEPA